MNIEKNYHFIKRQIETSITPDHIETCERLINERIKAYGIWDLCEELNGLVQVRKCELIAERYPETEGLA